MAAIAFVGDSFCSSSKFSLNLEPRFISSQSKTSDPTFINQIAESTEYNVYSFGYGGKSWWFSRCQFVKALDSIPRKKFRDQLEVIVFFHTNPGRINNAYNYDLDNTPSGDPAINSYYKHIFDQDFHKWAQQHWFREINQNWNQIKTIHFHSFTETLEYSHLLPGVVYNTPLIHVSVGELQGTKKEIDNRLLTDTRWNHLNTKNNMVLADIIIRTIDNYCPGNYDLDLSEFDIQNPNSINFPGGNYGTQQ